MSSGPGRELWRRFNRDPPLANDSLPSITGSTNTSSLPPLRSLGTRREPTTSSPGAFGSRPQSIVARWASSYRSISSITSDLANLDRDLENANSHLQALLDYTVENPSQPYMSTLSPPHSQPEHAEESRRIKRRKLDSDKIGINFKKFRYGKYGQVEAGQLHMEIVSCDGGLYSNESSYAAENILRNDTSVYCTKGNRCNIVLRHQGATVFSLKELIIKAPGLNYSSPVREGMVFVSMNQDDLLKRTAQYQIQYLRHGPGRSSAGPSQPIYSIRHEEDGSQSITAPSSRARRQQRRLGLQAEEEEENYRTAQIPSEFNVEPPPFNITTECSDDESEAEGAPLGRMRRRRTPNRIGTLPFESESSDEGADVWGDATRLESGWDATLEDLATHLRSENSTREIVSHYMREQALDRESESNPNNAAGLAEAQEASQAAMQEAVRAVGGSLMAPLAHFYIEKDKNKCTIRFDPPVSGRFILLKMWSPHHDPSANIDIQGVIAKGFAGPQYYPSNQLL